MLTHENIKTYFGIESQITKNEVTGKLQIYYLPGWVRTKVVEFDHFFFPSDSPSRTVPPEDVK